MGSNGVEIEAMSDDKMKPKPGKITVSYGKPTKQQIEENYRQAKRIAEGRKPKP